MAAARHVPELMDDAIEEVLLRCPPDDPSRLLRAALVCRRWRRLVTTPGFRRRYGERHRAPPALGFVCNLAGLRGANDDDTTAHFVPDTALSSSSSSRPLPRAAAAPRRRMRALDARHGRVLLHDVTSSSHRTRLAVWNPVTGEHRELPDPPVVLDQPGWSAAVLCAAAGRGGGCDHVGCHRGDFRVVVVGIYPQKAYTYSCAYSSEPGCVWSARTAGAFSQKLGCYVVEPSPSALVGNALHFVLGTKEAAASIILKYDLGTEQMSLMNLPQTGFIWPRIVLTTMEDGGLGFAIVGESKLYLWSKVDSSGAEWCKIRVIDLETLLPANALLAKLGAVGFAGGVGVIFLGTKVGNFLIDLKSNQAIKLGEGRSFHSVFPFTSFCCVPSLYR